MEIAALASLSGIFAITSIYTPQGVDFFAVAFFLLGSLLIDQRDIEAADWTGHRPFVFACAAVILIIPLVAGAYSANGFKSQVGSGVYIAAAPPALFLVAQKARYHLIGRTGVKYLILFGIFVGLIPAAIYSLVVLGIPSQRFFLPGQPALNIVSVYLSCVSAITLMLSIDLSRRARVAGYLAVVAMFALGLLTASRTFIVSELVVLVAYALAIRHNKVLLKEMAAMAVVLVPLLAASYFAFRGSLTRLFQDRPLGFFDGRLRTWADGWELFRRYPLFGIGPNTFYSQQLNPLYVERSREGIAYFPFYHAHNVFLNVLAEGGVAVGLLLVALIGAAVYGCYRILQNDPDDQFGLIAVTLLAVFLIIGLFENTMVRPVIFPLAIFLGLGLNVTWRGALQVEASGRVRSSAQSQPSDEAGGQDQPQPEGDCWRGHGQNCQGDQKQAEPDRH